ncbi:hypothetical protein SPHINGO391_350372 [Sphingomonas aurantiaca]|uniref:Uncharacterized protein n=1 Tax=Sphingomonas aurantiaca TaxID=185949 RepID=A0A5E7Y734_9SPHN|nr:hypothetical protein SPHINGO391_350372 [Sphingomonas aurantiaca]
MPFAFGPGVGGRATRREASLPRLAIFGEGGATSDGMCGAARLEMAASYAAATPCQSVMYYPYNKWRPSSQQDVDGP